MKLFKRLRNNKGFIGTSIAIGTALGVGGAGLAAGLTGGAVLGAAGLGIGSLLTGFGGSSTPQLPALPAPPSQAAADAKSRTDAVAEQRTKLRGSKTNLTGADNLLSVGQTTGKTLLGG